MTERELILATVRLVKGPNGEGGQGVLIPGRIILTAAHCIQWSCAGGMATGDTCLTDDYLETLRTNDGTEFRACPTVVEPVADIAVLEDAPPRFRDDIEQFDLYCKNTLPIALSTINPGLEEPFSLRIRSVERKWIKGIGRFRHERRTKICVEPEERIPSGSSGGPIVDDDGNLLGVVSYSSDEADDAMIPFAIRTLPVWVIEWIGGTTQRRQQEHIQKLIDRRHKKTV